MTPSHSLLKKKVRTALILSLLLFPFNLIPSPSAIAGQGGRQPQTATPAIVEWKFLDINQIKCTLSSDGPFADYRRTGSSGMEWPLGSGKTPIYTAGLWITGRHVATDSLRTASMDYSTEFQPGPLLELFNTTTFDDAAPRARASDPRYRLYKIQLGDTVSQDYQEWPGDLGAPFVDVNGNGTWDPGIDRPRFLGDQQLWCVMNDVNTDLHAHLGATPPMGIEMRALIYAVDRPGILGSTMFMEWTIINRSDADYDELYVSLWSDPDLGDANDDLPGSDSTLRLGYVYNGDDDDGTTHGYGSNPPAAGFQFLAGPLVPGSAGDSARLGDRWVHNYRNLPASSYVSYFGATFAELVDPPDGSPYYAPVAHDYQLGKAGTVGQYLRRADSSFYPLFWFSGDPVTGTGDLPQNFPLGVVRPQDLRMLISSGPFSLASGDTQYVAGAFLIAQGYDRLNSVTLLKAGSGDVRDFFAQGTSTVPTQQLVVSPGVILFDSTEVGDSSSISGIALSSIGHDHVTILGIEGPDPGTYAVNAPVTPLVLDSGETAAIALRFNPKTRGYHPDSLVLLTDDPSRPRRLVYIDGWGYTMVPADPGVLYGAGTFLEAIDPSLPASSTVGLLPSGPWGMAVSPSSAILYVVRPEGSGRSPLYRLCRENLDLVLSARIPLAQLKAIAFSSEDTLFAGTSDGRLYRVNLQTGDTLRIGSSSLAGYNGLTCSPHDGSLWGCALPTGLYDRDKIFKVDRATGQTTLVGMLGNNKPILSLAFGPDGTLFALQSEGGYNTLYQIDTTTGQGTLIGSLGVNGLTAIAMRTDISADVVEDRSATTPLRWDLSQNYPNPFNPRTHLRFELPEAAQVNITVFDLLGRRIRRLEQSQRAPGAFVVEWDARDDNGIAVSSGTYLVRMEATGRSGSGATILRKMIYLK